MRRGFRSAFVSMLALASTLVSAPVAAGVGFIGLGDFMDNVGTNGSCALSGDGTTVVGSTATTRPSGFRWKLFGGRRSLALLPDFDTNGASDVSRDGSVVVGSSRSSSLPFHAGLGTQAMLWQQASLPLGLGTLEPDAAKFDSRASFVSADGEVVVGFSRLPLPNPPPRSRVRYEPFRWTRATGMTPLCGGPCEGRSHEFVGMSADASTLVGSVQFEDEIGGFPRSNVRWTATAGFERLEPFALRGISGDGLSIVGSNESGDHWEAVRYRDDEGVRYLGQVEPDTASQALAASFDGSVIAGVSRILTGRPSFSNKAWVWDPRHGMRDLRQLLVDEGLGAQLEGWWLESVNDISDDGQVLVGLAYNAQRLRQCFVARIPEVLPIPIELDIKPWTRKPYVFVGKDDRLMVVILGSDELDVDDLDLASLRFGRSGAPPIEGRVVTYKDENGDGHVDFGAYYDLYEIGVGRNDTEACLTGSLSNGARFEGCDAIQLILR